ncbi:sulfatase [Marinovum sp.]|uniref:sulfatase n=1 Tax=Marinovum sp. TaxID=2024839 RepID=UPI002B27A8C9|nr:sulfatase [Marinovum sp.]
MKTIFVIFDSLNRTALAPYGGDATLTPNFARFADRAVTFDKHYVGSLPCMPARRDMHTGRLNMMHRPWGPLEPFDNSYAQMLSTAGVYTHMVTDHYHYFEPGGAGYAQAFDSWSFKRGQEYDPVTVRVAPDVAALREGYDPRHYPLDRLPEGTLTHRSTDPLAYRRMQHALNAEHMTDEADYPLAQCFASAFEFLDGNKDADDWLLQLECFDPHEPFMAADRFRDGDDSRPVLDWPPYERLANSPEEIDSIRGNYRALLRMCDDYFGQLLDWMDATGAWQDTCLIVTTDHGYLLGEHEWWGKNKMPCYEEIAHIPLMVWHPDHADQAGTRRGGVTQTMDIMPTLLELNGVPVPGEVQARSLLPHLANPDAPAEDRTVVFGLFGGPMGVTDGSYSYVHYPTSTATDALNMYTMAPQHMTESFSPEELGQAGMVPPLGFTKGARLMRVPVAREVKEAGFAAAADSAAGSAVYDLRVDPGQTTPIEAPGTTARLQRALAETFARHEAPPELFHYYGLDDVLSETAAPKRSAG